jgi:hypothetical protein
MSFSQSAIFLSWGSQQESAVCFLVVSYSLPDIAIDSPRCLACLTLSRFSSLGHRGRLVDLAHWHLWRQFFPLCPLFAWFQMFFLIFGLRGLVSVELPSNFIYPSTDWPDCKNEVAQGFQRWSIRLSVSQPASNVCLLSRLTATIFFHSPLPPHAFWPSWLAT